MKIFHDSLKFKLKMKLKMKMCCFNNFRPVGGWAVGEGSGVAWSVLRKHARTSALRFAFLAIADANADFGFGLLLGLFDLGFWLRCRLCRYIVQTHAFLRSIKTVIDNNSNSSSNNNTHKKNSWKANAQI